MSRPLRLVPQAAQPIEFSCPLCATVVAPYIFGRSQFRIFRCGGCALTFSKKASRGFDPSSSTQAQGPKARGERDHAGLLTAIEAAAINGPVLAVTSPQDGLVALLQGRGIAVGRVAGPERSEE